MIKILDYTENPIQYMGAKAGLCYGTDTTNVDKNFKRGMEIIEANHGRVLEFPDVVIEISGYSNRLVRELYTHIIGVTRLQESTRYINMARKFTEFYTPPSIKYNPVARQKYANAMIELGETYQELLEMGVPKEDLGNLVSLGQNTKMVLKINLRALMNLYETRTCTTAYKEFKPMLIELGEVLESLDSEWSTIMALYARTKCEKLGFCPEFKSCGRYPKKVDAYHDMLYKKAFDLHNDKQAEAKVLEDRGQIFRMGVKPTNWEIHPETTEVK